MNIDDIKNNINNRKSRLGQPIKIFDENMLSILKCLPKIENIQDLELKLLLQKSTIISSVTYFEVYFRDMLDAIFRMCKREAYISIIDKIHPQKYTVSEYIELDDNGIHPLELISFNLNFQNINNVNKVFSILLNVDFINKVQDYKYRINNIEFNTDSEIIKSVKTVLDYRHELVHNPKNEYQPLDLNIINSVPNLWIFAFSCDRLILDYMSKYIKEEVK